MLYNKCKYHIYNLQYYQMDANMDRLKLIKNNIMRMKKKKIKNKEIISTICDDHHVNDILVKELIKCDLEELELIYKCIIGKLNKNKSVNEIKDYYAVLELNNIVSYIVDVQYSESDYEYEEEYNYEEEYSEDDYIEYSECDEKYNPLIKFTWNDNQKMGFKHAVDGIFENGIHSQATGSGKSLMALKIMWEYHKQNPKKPMLWLCERKDIPQKLFFTKNEEGGIVHNIKNHNFWKQNDIINMDKFHIMEFVYTKKADWISDINKYKGKKPLFLIINRAFMTSKSKRIDCEYKYQEINKNKSPRFVIIDECHSSMATQTYQLLLYMKYNWGSTIQGLSATPYRKGKSTTNINIDINCNEIDDLNESENTKKLINVFHKPGNVNKLNILSWFNLKDAIEKGIILEPVFHWFRIEKYVEIKDKTNKKYKDSEQESIMVVLNNIIEQCKYKKCIVWCRLTSIADMWYDIFKKHKKRYNNLSSMSEFKDYSNVKSIHKNDYDKFYDSDDNCIMFCANKFREGSDIPYLSCCLFLDKVKNRGELPFIQCIGRVLRKDNEKLKQNGHILDGCTIGDDENKMKNIINKLLKYYIQLYEFSKSDFMIENDSDANISKLSQSKIDLYDNIMKSLKLSPDEKKVYIKLDNNKKIVIDVQNIDIKTMEWNKIIPKFKKVLKSELIVSEHEEYLIFKKKVIELCIKDKDDYNKRWKEYNLCSTKYVNGKDCTVKINPKESFPKDFKNWYDLLDINTDDFVKTLEEWKKICKENNVKSNKDYLKLCENDKTLPTMPEEYYYGYTNFTNEVNLNNIIFV